MAELNAPISTVSLGDCAPAAQRRGACAMPGLRHLDWFHDHVRIEQMLFEGAPAAHEGIIEPDDGRSGNGLLFKSRYAEAYAI